MNDDINHRHEEQRSGQHSIARRREILRRIGKASILAGAATPMAALATGSPQHWCKHPVDTTKCVHASISGMGSVLMSAQASNEVCSKKCSHYANTSNWVTCNPSTKFCVAFNCTSWTVKDSNNVQRCDQWGNENASCLLNKTLSNLCSSHSSAVEAHWATALGNAYKLVTPTVGAPFPYSPGEVVAYFGSTDLTLKSSAYTFFSTYCEQYA